MEVDYPEYFAGFYDLIYKHVRDGVDNTFYLNKIKETKGKVLEVGVGTGRHFIDALNTGADIYGIDISTSMLKLLESKLNPDQKKRISQKNIIDFESEIKFDLIIAPFRVFMHLIEKDDQLKALNNVFHNLNPGGKFIFDVFVPDLNQLIKGIDNLTDFEGEYSPGNRVKRIVSTKPDLLNQLININFRFEWNDNDLVYQKVWKTPLRYFFRYELEHLVERSDFNNYKILGDFQGNELNLESREFILICKKS